MQFYLQNKNDDTLMEKGDIGSEINVTVSRADNRLALRMKRGTGGFPLLDLSYGSVIVSDSYSELSLVLPTPIVYGQGAGALSFANASLNTNFNK